MLLGDLELVALDDLLNPDIALLPDSVQLVGLFSKECFVSLDVDLQCADSFLIALVLILRATHLALE